MTETTCRTGMDCMFLAGTLGLCIVLIGVVGLLKFSDWRKARKQGRRG